MQLLALANQTATNMASDELTTLEKSAERTKDIIVNSEHTGQVLVGLTNQAVEKIKSDKKISKEVLEKIEKSVETSVNPEHVAESVLNKTAKDAIKTDQKLAGILGTLEAESKKMIPGRNEQDKAATTTDSATSPRANESSPTVVAPTAVEESEGDSTAPAPQTGSEQRVNELAGQFRLLYKATEAFSVANLSAVEMAKV